MHEAKIHLQTAHGRAQRRVLALGWVLFFGLNAVLAMFGIGPSISWGLTAVGVALVALGFGLAAFRRETFGLYIDGSEYSAGRLLGTSIAKGVGAPSLDVREQRDFRYLRLQRRPNRWVRVPYFTHVPSAAPLRFLYPDENAVLIETPDGWKPTGLVWSDSSADQIVRAIEQHRARYADELTQENGKPHRS